MGDTGAVVETADLRRALAAIKAATAGKGNIDVASAGKELRFTANNPDVRLSYAVPVIGRLATEASVPAKNLLDLAQRIDRQGTVDLSCQTEHLVVRTATGAIKVRRAKEEVWPWPKEQGPTFDLDEDALDAIARVGFAAGTDEYRPILTSIEVSHSHVVATDSYRLAIAEVDLLVEDVFLLPAKAVRYLPIDPDDDLVVTTRSSSSKSSASWQVGPLSVDVMLTQGTYPSWHKLVPTKFTGAMTVDPREAAAALRRIGRWVDASDGEGVQLVREGDDKVAFSSYRSENEVVEYVAAEFSGTWPAIGFNPIFLAEGFEAMLEPTATLQVQNEIRPAVIAEPGFRYLLMPVRMSR